MNAAFRPRRVLAAVLATLAVVSVSAPAQDTARTPHPQDVAPTWWLELGGLRDRATGTVASGVLVRADGDRAERSPNPSVAAPRGWSPDRAREVVAVYDRTRRERDLFVRPVRAGRLVTRAEQDRPAGEVRLTRDHDDLDPTWTRDSSSILFRSDRGGDGWQLWQVSADGGEPERLTSGDAKVHEAALSPDGRSVLLIRSTQRPPERRQGMRTRDFDVSILDLETGAVRTLVGDVFTADAAWSPDGTRVACGLEDRIVVLDVSTIEPATGIIVRSWNGGDADPRARGYGATSFLWRPDGLAFACRLGFLGQTSSIAGEETKMFGDDEVFVFELDGGTATLSPPTDDELRARWSGWPVAWRRLPR